LNEQYGRRRAAKHAAVKPITAKWSKFRPYADHAADMMRSVNLDIDMRVSCPHSTQQCTAHHVEWAKRNRQFLILTREIMLWRV
jgi:hypothetical protein